MSPSQGTRRRFLAKTGIDPSRVFAVRQVHSHEVIVAENGQSEPVADGLVAANRCSVLSVTVADCLPIFLLDKQSGSFGIVHSGWRGTGIVIAAARLMQQVFGTTHRSLRVVIGPGIGVCCYQVSEQRFIQYTEQFGTASGEIRKGQCYLNLRQANLALLLRRGIEDICIVTDCTACNPLLSSFRRDGAGNFNRMVALVGYSFMEM